MTEDCKRLLGRAATFIGEALALETDAYRTVQAGLLLADIGAALRRESDLTIVDCVRDPEVRTGRVWFRPRDWPSRYGALAIASNDNYRRTDMHQEWIVHWNAHGTTSSIFIPRLSVLEAPFVRVASHR